MIASLGLSGSISLLIASIALMAIYCFWYGRILFDRGHDGLYWFFYGPHFGFVCGSAFNLGRIVGAC